MTSPRNQIPSDKVCCMNCRYMGWHVAVGQGVRCWNPENQRNPHPGLKAADPAPLIPSPEFVCEKFEWRRPSEASADPKGGAEIAVAEPSPTEPQRHLAACINVALPHFREGSVVRRYLEPSLFTLLDVQG
jgi:hypothetical protein